MHLQQDPLLSVLPPLIHSQTFDACVVETVKVLMFGTLRLQEPVTW